MFEEAQYFAPLRERADGTLAVELGRGHPGFADAAYRARRDTLATLAAAWHPGMPVPTADYTDAEHAVWAAVSTALMPLHRSHACREFLEGKEIIDLPDDHIPQLAEVSATLRPLTAFTYRPAAGLVPLDLFYGSLAERIFHSTQYVRHHSVPLYTPEPDVIHEVIGHGTTLAHPRFTALYELAGAAARRVSTPEALEFISKVFWFTLEFGVVWQGGELKAYGAGILSSPGETAEFRDIAIRPLDLVAMGTTSYDITAYQPLLYAAESFSHVEDVVGGFWATCTDASIADLTARSAAGFRTPA